MQIHFKHGRIRAVFCSSGAEGDGQNGAAGAEHRLSSGIYPGRFLGPPARCDLPESAERVRAHHPLCSSARQPLLSPAVGFAFQTPQC